jgi:outer membrane immunogenic protein
MKKSILGLVAIGALIAGPAMAADLRMPVKAPPAPIAPAYSWTGFYLGIEGGGGWADTQQTDTAGTTSGVYHQSGGLIGGTIGYNWQVNNVVFGAEADMSWSGIDGSVSLPTLCTAGMGTNCFTNMDWLNTDRLRLGLAFGNNGVSWMPYITGGLAGAGIHAGQQSCSTPIVGAIASCGSRTEWGGVIGGGIEAMFAPNWSAKIEYLHTDFGTHTFYTVVIPVNVTEKNVNIVRAGVNYHFNFGGPIATRY